MLIGYMRVSKTDGSQATDLQRDAFVNAGVDSGYIYEDFGSGLLEARPGLGPHIKLCEKVIPWQYGDSIVWAEVWHLINTMHDLTHRGIGLKVLAGQEASIDTTTSTGKLVFGIFTALAEFERELIAERTRAGLAAARARGGKGGAPFKMTPAKLRRAMAAMGEPETVVGKLCRELGITRQTLYRHVDPKGALRNDGNCFWRGLVKNKNELNRVFCSVAP